MAHGSCEGGAEGGLPGITGTAPEPPGTNTTAAATATAATPAPAAVHGFATRRTRARRRSRSSTASTSTVDGGTGPITASNCSLLMAPPSALARGDERAQRVEPARGLALHGSRRTLEDFGGLLDGEVAVVAQHHRGPAPRRQRVEQLEQAQPFDDVVTGQHGRFRQRPRRFLPPPRAGLLVEPRPHQDPAHVGV